MQVVLLSGGSGKRLWPISNDVRSKQFLKLLTSPSGQLESMLERISRQFKESGIGASLTVTTSLSQKDSVINQLGTQVDVVTEPERRDTFPAIALSVSYLLYEKGCSPDEVVVVMPSDSFVEADYFHAITRMAQVAQDNTAQMVLMGITPTTPSTKFGYILPQVGAQGDVIAVDSFAEKPSKEVAAELLAKGAFWNGGAFAFKLGYIASILDEFIAEHDFGQISARYAELPKISFDYQVVERTASIALVPYGGTWSDLGTWNSLSHKIENNAMGNVVLDERSVNTHVVNELDLPIICLGARDLVVAASPDGILVSDKAASVDLKSYADKFTSRPMYEERRWGTYRVMGHEYFADGYTALTKLLYIKPGCSISYQYHNLRDEVWTVVDGRGLLALDGEVIEVSRGYVAHIKSGQRHAIKALTGLQIIEVQSGTELVEQDIIRLDWQW